MTDQPKDTRLWCLHHIGADEVHPAPDFSTAQTWADWANKQFSEHADISRFVVAVWPHSAERHAAWLIKALDEWTLPEQPVDAKREALIAGLMERIHWQIDCEVKREDVAGMIDSLDEYGMAFVSIPRWTCASDAQRAVDAYYKGDADPRLIEAVRCVLEQRFSTYRARNGREVGIQGDDGEKVWLVHSETMWELESAYGAMEQKRRAPAEEAVPHRWKGVIPLIEQITVEEGANVTFVCANPDFNGLPNEAVTVFQGEDWQEVTYRADTLADCLRAALENKATP